MFKLFSPNRRRPAPRTRKAAYEPKPMPRMRWY